MIDFNHIQENLFPPRPLQPVMKVPLHIVLARRERLATWLQQHSYVPLSEVCAQFQISEATARRDLSVLAAGNHIRRTASPPSWSASGSPLPGSNRSPGAPSG
jgi:hypothetical protein